MSHHSQMFQIFKKDSYNQMIKLLNIVLEYKIIEDTWKIKK
jgi:hypothetical protein